MLQVDLEPDLLAEPLAPRAPRRPRRPPRSSPPGGARRAAAAPAATCRSAGGRRPRRVTSSEPRPTRRRPRSPGRRGRAGASSASRAPPAGSGRGRGGSSSGPCRAARRRAPRSPRAAARGSRRPVPRAAARYTSSCASSPRGQVAQVLVDPVRGERADHPVVPPVLRGHLLPPRPRAVPVVAQVVVVQDHAGRHGGQQPAHRRGAPRLVVEPGVLLEVDDLLADVVAVRTLGRGLALAVVVQLAQPLLQRRRRVVGVDLVADQQQQVGGVPASRRPSSARTARPARRRPSP